tara:strand:- start:665 stop:1510 length:846 start_codon:yes stop_codon:yes gene_type:complete
LKTSIYKKIKHLLSLYPKTEWSGVAFYNKLNEDTYGWATKWELVAFYPIDLGSTAATEFSGEEVLNMTQKAYDKNPKLKECYKGLIHSHHTLSGGAFFSGTDRNQMEECANVVGYPSLVVANDSTGSPFAFSVSWLDQLGKIHWTEESEGCVTLNYTNYKPSGLFEECLDSLKKQESVIKNSSLTYFNGKQGSLFNNGMYNRVGLYQPHTNQFNDDYKDNIKDKKYQKLLKKFRKADNLFFDSHVTDDLSYNKKKEDAVNAEAELDAYCIEKGYNQEMGWL